MGYSRRQRFSDGASGLPRVEFAREFDTAVRPGAAAGRPAPAAGEREPDADDRDGRDGTRREERPSRPEEDRGQPSDPGRRRARRDEDGEGTGRPRL